MFVSSSSPSSSCSRDWTNTFSTPGEEVSSCSLVK
ncbi:hypothetical protein A2U01_0089095, partial [Trifolium medium]|nr:hypothetical protein [Trifolium medium]